MYGIDHASGRVGMRTILNEVAEEKVSMWVREKEKEAGKVVEKGTEASNAKHNPEHKEDV